MPDSAWIWAAAVLVTLAAAGVQRLIGFGFAVISVPVLALLHPALSPVPQLLMSLPLTMWMGWRERHALDLSGVGWVLAGRLPGALLGIVLLKVLSPRELNGVIAVLVLGAVLIVATGVKVRRTPVTKFAAGVASGTSGLVASTGGPPLAILYKDARGEVIRSSLAAIFTIGIVITISARLLAGEIRSDDVTAAALLFPALVAGYVLARPLVGRIEGKPLRIGILAASTAAAGALLARNLAL